MIKQAKAFAEKAHHGQVRKVTQEPYINHPLRVAERLRPLDVSDELICAAYLHDVVEDTAYTLQEIEQLFGARVAELVGAHTENKTKSWRERKQETITTLKTAEKEVRYLIVADRLDNLLDFEKDLNRIGPGIWDHFNAGYEEQKWYNQAIRTQMSQGLDSDEIPPFFATFTDTVARLFD